jgi:hypothetical protein
VLTGSAERPSFSATYSSTCGSMLAKVPTAPEIAQVAISSRAASSRALQRENSAWACASLSPKVTGSAWMPWLRPMVGVYLCSSARAFSAASSPSRSASRMSLARANCTASVVSSTSELVMPWCMKRASGPTCSATQSRKAMTSCLSTASFASIAATSMAGFLAHQSHRALAALSGTTPRSASFCVACASISNQMRYRASASHSAVICGRA